MIWTGRIEFQVQSMRKGRDRDIELMVRRELIELLVDGRSRGYVDRDALRLWLARPQDQLHFDDAHLTITVGGLGLALIVGETVLPLPSRVEHQLREVA
jgi:hypothetical protein